MSAARLALLWLRPLWQRPGRALATTLGVAAGVAAVLATALASRAAVASLTDDVEALAGAARLEVTRPGGVPVADMARLAAVCGEVHVAPVLEDVALCPATETRRTSEIVRLLGIDGLGIDGFGSLDSAVTGKLETEVGRRFLAREGVVLARSAAERLGVAAGGTLGLVVQSRPVALEVLALFEPARVPTAWERVVVLDVALAQELLGRREHLDRLELVPRAGVALDDDALAARVTALLPEGTRVAPASERRAEGERFVRSLTFNLTALAGVSVLVSVVLVATTLATSVVQRRSALALLRSLGASRAQLALAVLSEAALTGLAGGVLGVALGWLGARLIAADVHGSFATLAEDVLVGAVRLSPSWAAAGVALGLASALAAAFLPLAEAWRTPPVQHLRTRRLEERPARGGLRALACLGLGAGAWLSARLPAWHERPIWALVSALFLLAVLIVLSGPAIDLAARVPLGFLGRRLGTPLRLAQAALASARRRAAWAASAVGVAVALAVAMSVMVGSFRANVIDWTAQTMRSDLYLRPLSNREGATVGRIAPEALALVEQAFGADHVDPYHETSATVNGQRIALGGVKFAIVAREGGVPLLDGRPSQEAFREALARHGVVANEPFARRFGLGRGDRVRITTAGGTLECEIVAVYRDFSAHTGRLVLDLADFLPLAGDEGAHNVAVFLPDTADVARERARLSELLAGRFALEVLDNRELHGEVLRVFERTFAITVALQVMAALVAALAVVLVLTALVRERERELAVVRVLGGSRAQLAALVGGQALLLGSAGALGGVAVGLVVGYILVAVVNLQSFGWSLRFTLPASALWSASAVLPACLLASWLPAWLSLRQRPQEALREPD